MDNGNNRNSGTAAKTILVVFFIIGLLIVCAYLYLKSFMDRVTAYELSRLPIETTWTIKMDGWNNVDEDTMKAIRERYPHLGETTATTSNYYDDEAVKALFDEMDKEAAKKRAEDIRSVLERDRGNDKNPDKSSDVA